jgi:hypothetical protein
MQGEPWISIADDFCGESEPFIHMIQVQLCNSWARDCCCAREEDCCPRTAVVDYCEDRILSIVHGQSSNQVHGNLLKGESLFVGGDAIQGCLLLMSEYFVLLACCTFFNIVCDPLVHSWPLVPSFGPSDGFVTSWVSCRGVVISIDHDEMFPFFIYGGAFTSCIYELVCWNHRYTLIVFLALVDPRWA